MNLRINLLSVLSLGFGFMQAIAQQAPDLSRVLEEKLMQPPL